MNVCFKSTKKGKCLRRGGEKAMFSHTILVWAWCNQKIVKSLKIQEYFKYFQKPLMIKNIAPKFRRVGCKLICEKRAGLIPIKFWKKKHDQLSIFLSLYSCEKEVFYALSMKFEKNVAQPKIRQRYYEIWKMNDQKNERSSVFLNCKNNVVQFYSYKSSIIECSRKNGGNKLPASFYVPSK